MDIIEDALNDNSIDKKKFDRGRFFINTEGRNIYTHIIDTPEGETRYQTHPELAEEIIENDPKLKKWLALLRNNTMYSNWRYMLVPYNFLILCGYVAIDAYIINGCIRYNSNTIPELVKKRLKNDKSFENAKDLTKAISGDEEELNILDSLYRLIIQWRKDERDCKTTNNEEKALLE